MLSKFISSLICLLFFSQLLSQNTPELILQRSPPGHISDLKITKDGRYLSSIGASNQLKVWDLKTYKLLYNFQDHRQRIQSLDISEDGQYAVTGGEDNWVVLTNLNEGRVVEKYEIGEPVCRVAFADLTTIYVLTRKCTLYKVDLASGKKERMWSRGVKLWAAAFDIGRKQILLMPSYLRNKNVKGFEQVHLKTGKLISQVEYNQGDNFNTRWVKYLPSLQRLVACEVKMKGQRRPIPARSQLWIFEPESKTWQRISIPMQVEDVSVYKKNQFLLSGPDEGLAVYDLHQQKITRRIKTILLSPYARTYLKGHRIAYLPKENVVAIAMHDIRFVDLGEERLLRTFSNNIYSTRDARLTTDGKYWYCASYNKAMLISTRDASVAFECSRFKVGILSPDGTHRVVTTREPKIHLLDIFAKDTIWSSPRLSRTSVGASISQDNRYVATIQVGRSPAPEIQIWDTKSKRLLDQLPGSSHNGLKPTLSKTGRFLGVGMDSEGTRIYKRNEDGKYKLIINHPSQQVIALAFDPLERMAAVVTSNGRVLCFDLKQGKLQWEKNLKESQQEPSQLVFSRDYLYIGTFYTGQILRLRTDDGKVLQQETIHADNIRAISITEDDRYLMTNGQDDLILIHKVDELKPKLGMMFYTPSESPDWTDTKDDYVLFTPEGFYWSFGQAYEGIGFRVGKNAYPVENFDLWYSRPDKVVEALPYSADSLAQAYLRAYQERLHNYQVAERLDYQEIRLPQLELTTQNIPKTVRERSISVPIRAVSAPNSYLRRIQVYINDVPIYGRTGIVLASQQLKTYRDTLDIRLMSGVNKIQISVIDQQELESMRETFYINYEPSTVRRPKLYFLSITVSKFQNEDDNLPFAAADLDSLKLLFSKPEHPVYDEVQFHSLLDKEVNEDGIQHLRNILKNTHIEDRVILHVATHGLRDVKNRLFLATPQTDFYKPEENSISYEQIEKLMDGIPARRKLILLDACRAGEFDERAFDYRNEQNTPENIMNGTTYSDWDNPYELARELFTDLRRRDGSTIIVGAQADEASREGGQWNMSVLMHFFVKALKEKAADLITDGQITVSELQQYLISQVSAATNGRQNPAARMSNLSNDWQIW
ncbi:MAG: WD40 repeat domain-containing protein [Saprospiraceae bacterium]|nr:WD40 repeat domain-containing protein [Saprospiraceae bacterium]